MFGYDGVDASVTGGGFRYPLVFCRDCDQEYYMVSWQAGVDGEITPRPPVFYAEEEDEKLQPGYAALDEGKL